MINANKRAILPLLSKYRLLSIGNREFAEAGGLAGYGVDYFATYRRAAVLVDKILKGTKPADIPIEQATKFVFVINLKTAKALDIAASATFPAGNEPCLHRRRRYHSRSTGLGARPRHDQRRRDDDRSLRERWRQGHGARVRPGNDQAYRNRHARGDPQDSRRRLYRRLGDRQCKGFINSVYAATYGNAIAAAILYFDPAIADYHNQGTMAPIKVVAPPGSVVNCQYPATVGASPVNVGIQVMESVLEALSKALPQRAVAAWAKHRGDYVFAVDPRTGERYVRTSFDYDGSSGAVWGYDGYQAVSTLTALGAAHRDNVEEMEVRVPWRALKWEMAPDFTGAGKWRGGPGVHWEAINEGTDGQMATGSSDGDVVQGFGALGGEPTPVSRTWLRRNGEDILVEPHRLVPIKTGDVLVKHSSGGGGVGQAAERDPEVVREDVENGLVSITAAKETYKVVIDPATLKVDQAATKALRAR
jgi:hypothetical protein